MKSLEYMSRIELELEIEALRKKLEEKQEFINFLINRIENILNFDDEVKIR